MKLKDDSTFEEALRWASLFLEENHFHDNEALNYLNWLMDWSLTDYFRNKDHVIGLEISQYLESSYKRIIYDEPIQYIVGYADFMNRRYKVTRDTLIPREETTGIIDLVSKYIESTAELEMNIIDIGTGTGIIPITLKKEFPNNNIYASDISKEALEVAKDNANNHQADINFIQSDIFDAISKDLQFDIIVSNPPYISEDEVNLMDQSVLKYEPHLALFSENHGLYLIEKIIKESVSMISKNGYIILEVGFQQGNKVEQICRKYFPSGLINIHKDINGLNRFVSIEVKEI